LALEFIIIKYYEYYDKALSKYSVDR